MTEAQRHKAGKEKAQCGKEDKALSSKNFVPLCLCASVPSFTLIELMMVIAVIAILLGISSPAFMGLGRGAGMNGAVTSVRSTLSMLRQWAVTHREEVRFHYFASVAPSASYYYAATDAGIIIKTNELTMDVMFGGDGEVRFKSDGGLASGAPTEDVVINMRAPPVSATKTNKIIKINGLTGGMRVE